MSAALRAVPDDQAGDHSPVTGDELVRRVANMIRADLHRVPLDDPMRPGLIALTCAAVEGRDVPS